MTAQICVQISVVSGVVHPVSDQIYSSRYLQLLCCMRHKDNAVNSSNVDVDYRKKMK